eukprot:3881462-Alexandrium_andersonii.AAC.1
MSASLVGSEMCIRDSLLASVLGTVAEFTESATSRTVNMRDDGSFGTCAPVSYTHLTLPTICSV